MKKHNAISFPPYIWGDKSFPMVYVCSDCRKLIMDIDGE